MAIHKIVEDNDSYVSEYYEEPANSGNGEGRKTWLAIPFCRYMESCSHFDLFYGSCNAIRSKNFIHRDIVTANHLQVVFLGFLGFANVYAMRVNLSVAIVYMVNHTAIDSNTGNGSNGGVGASNGSSGDVCPMPEDGNGTAQHLHDG